MTGLAIDNIRAYIIYGLAKLPRALILTLYAIESVSMVNLLSLVDMSNVECHSFENHVRNSKFHIRKISRF